MANAGLPVHGFEAWALDSSGESFGPASCSLRITVVARHKAMLASNWFAMPKSGQSELMPPSGSRTPWMRK